MMANPWAGEVELGLDGTKHVMKLTLGALAELETALGAESLTDLAARLESGGARSGDLISLLHVGLKAGGWSGSRADLLAARVDGGVAEAMRAGAKLFLRAFHQVGAAE